VPNFFLPFSVTHCITPSLSWDNIKANFKLGKHWKWMEKFEIWKKYEKIRTVLFAILKSCKLKKFKGLKLSHLVFSIINQTFISYDVKVVLKNSVKERTFIATFALNFTVFVNILSFYSAIKIEHQAINYKSEIVLQVLVSLSLSLSYLHSLHFIARSCLHKAAHAVKA